MTCLKTWMILGCVLSVLEFSVGDRKIPINAEEPDHSEISDSGEARREQLVSALQKGEMSTVMRLIEERVLEEYYHGIYDKKEWNVLNKITDKVSVLASLLRYKLVSIPTNNYVTRHPSNKRLFNVTLIPGTDLTVRLLVNLTAVKDESLAKEWNAPPLHLICSLPDVEPDVVKIFLDFGTVEIDAWDKTSYITALISATINGNYHLVKFLVENGADINNSITTTLDIKGRKDHKYDYMNVFTRKPVIASGINITVSAVLAAAYENQADILRYLLENGGEVNKISAWFVLFRPAYKGYAEVVEILLKNGIDVNTKGPFGSTTLHRVAETGNEEMAKLLLMNGADSNLTNSFGWTPLHVAALFGINNTKPIVKLLLDSGCNINALTDGGFSPLNLAEAGSNIGFLNYLVNNSDMLKFNKHKNLTESKHSEGHAELVQLLLNRGAELDHQDNILRWTTLHWAAANGDLRIAKLLVEEYGASTTLKSKMGMTPFRTAKYFGREAVSEYLNTGRNLVE